MNIVYSIYNEIQWIPEIVIEHEFSVRSNFGHIVFDIESWIYTFSNSSSGCWLGVTDIAFSEEELSIKVAHFNIVIIGNMDFTSIWTSNTHQGESFN